MPAKKRIERDSMGPMPVPADAYYGASTQRAVLNFPISNLRFSRSFIRALALIKLCAADVNAGLKLLDKRTARAIMRAARETAAGKFDNQFVVDVFQTGSGTSTNMNANEVIATRARELLSGQKSGRTLVHPNDHVNLGQSSNDVIPTATHIAALIEINEVLLPALAEMHDSLEGKAKEFATVIKTGRTHLQDAMPITLGQEFSGYAGQILNCIARLRQATERLRFVALGGTAVGTGVNTHGEFAARVCAELTGHLGFSVAETENHFHAQATMDEVVQTSGVLRTLAVALTKIANDTRWMGSGPRAGFGEITLPEVQPGSSIMPGKVNPVIAESLLQVAVQVFGNDGTITYAGQSGVFELNMMWPVAAFNLLQSIQLLAASASNFTQKCLNGISATSRGPDSVAGGLALVTALVPRIGYDEAAQIAHEASLSGETVHQVALRRTSLTAAELTELLDPARMV